MTDQERTALEWRLATRLGDDAWEFNQYGGFHEPKPLARSLDVLVPLVEAWCERPEWGWWVQRLSKGKFYGVIVDESLYDIGECWADTPAEALALALDAALAQEGGAK